jgi:uncharacterized protein
VAKPSNTMLYLEEISLKVEAFYLQLDQKLLEFKKQAKYSCIAGCSKCCTSPTIEASILEVLPLAFLLFKENKAEQVYDRLTKERPLACILHEPLLTCNRVGGCTEYAHRALICRLFAFSFTRDKVGKAQLMTCKDIKENYFEQTEHISKLARNGLVVPMAANYQTILSNIDYALSQQQYPINESIKLALEMVLNHFHYHPVIQVDTKMIS